MFDVSVNYLAVLAAAVASIVLGALWYSPLLFGKMWMRLSGKTMADMKGHEQEAMRGYALQAVASLVMAYVLAHFVYYTQALAVSEGFQLGFWLWLGFVATFSLGSVLWEGKSLKLWALNNAYNLVALMLMSVILVQWQ